MGFLDSLLGKTRLPESKTEKLFAISTAAVTLDASLGLRPDGAAAICIKPLESSRYDRARQEIEELLKISSRETGTAYEVHKDEFNYVWIVLNDPDFDDLVTSIQMVAQTLIENGFGTQLLAAIYRFRGESAAYWIYNFKQGAYYPFVPTGDKQRNNSMEIRLGSLMEKEMPVQKMMEMWYPMWGMPI